MKMSKANVQSDSVVEINPQPDLLTFSKAIGDEVRLRILRILRNESFGVLELCDILDLKQSALSHHLKILSDAQLLSKRREGNSIFYSRNVHEIESLADLQSTFYKSVDGYVLEEDIVARIKSLQQARELKSHDFFQLNAREFAKNQELVAPITAYADQLTELIAVKYDATNAVRALEIGPGTGEFIPKLVSIFGEIDVIDNSPEMLKAAKSYCLEQGVTGVEYISGDTQSEQLQDGKYDCVVMNMVLHHNASPSRILLDVEKKMQVGGRLFISELAAHQQDWVRDSCGDIWLGFNSDELDQMAIDAGLIEGSSSYYAQRNGFVVLLKEYIKPVI